MVRFKKRIQTIRGRIERDVVDLKLLNGEIDVHVDNFIKSQYSELIRRVHADYQTFLRGKKIRPTFGNDVTILYLRDRMALLQLIFPEIDYLVYQAGKAIGRLVVAPNIGGNSIRSVFKQFETFSPLCKYGRYEIVRVGVSEGVWRIFECADCYGMPNVGRPLCRFEAGITAGILEEKLKAPFISEEVKCWGLGDNFCEFHVRSIQK